MALPPMMNGGNGTMAMPHRKKMMMHMTFYWGNEALILFKGWPGTNMGMYFLSLAFVFLLSLLVEWLAHCSVVMKKSNDVATHLAQTLVYTLRVGLGFMMMLALMSFNVGVFLVAVLGHGLGFFFFRVNMKSSEKNKDDFSMVC